MQFNFESLFAIWSLFPQRFHYCFFLSIVSWQYQKILIHSYTCTMPSECNGLLIFLKLCHPAFTFLQQVMTQRLCVIYTNTCSPRFSTSSHQPQTHCIWQALDSVCTTVLTVTLSQKQKCGLHGFFKRLSTTNLKMIWKQTTNKQTNVIDLTIRTLATHTNTHRQTNRQIHTHTHTHALCVCVCVFMCIRVCACVGVRAWAGVFVCVWVSGCM